MLKKEWVFLNTFFITSQQLHNHKSNLILPPTGALQAIEIGTPPNFIGVEAEKFVKETFHLKLPI